MGIKDLLGYTPELLAGLSGVVPDDYGLATSLYLSNLAKEYNMKLAESLGIDVSTIEKYNQFVRTNPNAYKHAFLKHQLGYGLLEPTLGGMIQAHIIKNKMNRLQSMDSSEINENGRFFDMFKEILQAYKTCEDKTNFLAGQVPEEIRPELLVALDTNDETKFNDLMNSIMGSNTVVDEKTEEAIEPNESGIQIGPQPEVPDTVADKDPNTINPVPQESIEDGTLPDGNIGTMLSEEELAVAVPTLESVANMTEQVQNLEDTEGIPDNLREGVEIWKDADEDFSIKIVAETVKRLHKGDFSEEKDISEGEILVTGAKVAKDLKDAGENKTSLTKGIEEVEKDIKVMNLAELYSILGELKNLKDSVINFVEFIAEKDDLGLSPSKKRELVDEILNEGIFVDGTDKLKKDVAETLNSSADYSAKDMNTRLSIFKDFSEEFEDRLPKLSDEARECIEYASENDDPEDQIRDEVEVKSEVESDTNNVSDEAIKIADEAGTVDKAIMMVEDRINELESDKDVLEGFTEFSMDCAAQIANSNNIDPDLYVRSLVKSINNRTPYQELVLRKMFNREKDYYKPKFLGGPGSKRYEKKYGNLDNISTQLSYAMPNLLAKYGYSTDLGDLMLSEAMHRNIGHGNFSEAGDFGRIKNLGIAALLSAGGIASAIHGGIKLGNINAANMETPAAIEYITTQNELARLPNEEESSGRVESANYNYDRARDIYNKHSDTYSKSKSKNTKEILSNILDDDSKYVSSSWDKLRKANEDYYSNKAKRSALDDKLDDITNNTDPKTLEKAIDYVNNPGKATSDTITNASLAGAGALAAIGGAGLGVNELKKFMSDDEKSKRLEKRLTKRRGKKAILKWMDNSSEDDVVYNLTSGKKSIEGTLRDLIALKNQYQSEGKMKEVRAIDKYIKLNKIKLANADGLLRAHTNKDFAEGEAPAEEQISQEVIDNALSNDDQIRALVEKYKMLPTIEAKEQMKADMHTLGFNDEVIEMIENYAEGNFSEGEVSSTEVCPNCGKNPCICGVSSEETVDVASMVTPELFDSLLGPGVGESDPVDGTLPVGEVEAPGTDIGHLGTLDEGIPAGEPAPEDNRDVTKVEIVNSDGDEFESIMR